MWSLGPKDGYLLVNCGNCAMFVPPFRVVDVPCRRLLHVEEQLLTTTLATCIHIIIIIIARAMRYTVRRTEDLERDDVFSIATNDFTSGPGF